MRNAFNNKPSDVYSTSTSGAEAYKKIYNSEQLLGLACEKFTFARSDDAEKTLSLATDYVKQGADINYTTGYEGSLLEAAISAGNVAMVQFMLDNGANIRHRTVAVACSEAGRVEDQTKDASAKEVAARQQIALAVIAKAAKEDFIGAGYREETVFKDAAPSATVTAALKEALKTHGLNEANLLRPKQRAMKFIRQKLHLRT